LGRSRRWSFLLQDLGLSLVQAGWLVSLTEAGGAGLGLAAGFVIARLGSRRALTIGLVLLAAASLGEGLAPGVAALFAARLAESLGYLFIVIAAPSLVAALASPEQRAAALALRSAFVRPVSPSAQRSPAPPPPCSPGEASCWAGRQLR